MSPLPIWYIGGLCHLSLRSRVGDTLAALGVRFEDWLEKEAENEQELLIERRMPKAVRAPVPVAKSKTSEGKKNSKRTRRFEFEFKSESDSC